jgi:hypothetical protein
MPVMPPAAAEYSEARTQGSMIETSDADWVQPAKTVKLRMEADAAAAKFLIFTEFLTKKNVGTD